MRIFRKRKNKDPEELIDAVILDMKHRLTEARIQIAAADLARQGIRNKNAISYSDIDPEDSARVSLSKLENMLNDLILKRNLLIARAHDADMRLAIERAMMDSDSEPAQIAIDMLNERIQDSESKTDAVKDIRNVTNGGGVNASK